MNSYRTLALLLCALLLCACAPARPLQKSTVSASGDAIVDDLADRYYEDMLALNPLTATYIGDSRYNDRLAMDITASHIKAMEQHYRSYLAAAKRIDTATLSEKARLTRDVLEFECAAALAVGAYPNQLMPASQWGGLPLTMPQLGSGDSAQPFETVADYENFLRRLVDFKRWTDHAISNFDRGIREGVVLPRALVKKMLPQMAAQIVAVPTDSVFYGPIKSLPDTFAASDRRRLSKRYERAIRDDVVPTYRRLHDYLRDQYLPHARDSVALTALPQGHEWYAALIRLTTTTSLSADEIHTLGLAEVARIRAEMAAIQQRLGIKGSLRDFFRALEADPALYFTDAEALLAAHRSLKATLDVKLPTLFSKLPKAEYEVRAVEAYREQASAGAFYQQPSADASRPGIFYVNTYNLKAQPKFLLTTLSLHEAAPGHHFQISLQQEIEDLPKFRRYLVGYVAYVEGWAMYAETLGHEMGLFNDPYQHFGHLNDEMLRAMRLVVDTGLHTKGWSREHAIAYMIDNSSIAASDAEAEVERYIADPGQALGYKVGALRIRALRTQAERELGAAFDIKAFHTEILCDGPLPLDLLTAKIDRWIKAQRTQPN